MTDMLDYAGFYSFNPEYESDKFENHQRIRKKDETFSIGLVKYFMII